MTYRIVITANAEANLVDYGNNATRHAPQTALKWLERFRLAIDQLSINADRMPLADEAAELKLPIRQMLFGKRPRIFRVFFIIEEDEVKVLHIRRATMRRATLDDMQ